MENNNYNINLIKNLLQSLNKKVNLNNQHLYTSDCTNYQDYFFNRVPKFLKDYINNYYSTKYFHYHHIPTYFVKEYFIKNPSDLKGFKIQDFINFHITPIKEHNTISNILFNLYPIISDNYVDFLDEMLNHFKKTNPSYYNNPYENEYHKTRLKIQLNNTINFQEELSKTKISKDYNKFLDEMNMQIYQEKIKSIEMFSTFLKANIPLPIKCDDPYTTLPIL